MYIKLDKNDGYDILLIKWSKNSNRVHVYEIIDKGCTDSDLSMLSEIVNCIYEHYDYSKIRIILHDILVGMGYIE